jgi:histidinol phosphatase-like PHP family hydrolase
MRFTFVFIAVFIVLSSSAQRKLNDLPDIPGYVTLKADFHVHTDFSDGVVWPTFRVDEAVREGIDIIAITDHVEYRPHKDFMKSEDHNQSYDIALPYAKERNVVLVKGVEITRPMPTGHMNALFVTDVNKLTDPDFMKVVEEAVRQGAFIFWNHPGWKTQQPDGIPKFHPVHEEMYKKGWLHGIEFYNTKGNYAFVLDWCNQRNLTVLSNSDVHIAASDFWELSRGEVRPVTLVFAKERNVEGVRDALKNGRTLALFHGDSLGGKKEWAEAFFRSSIKIDPPHFENNDVTWVQITNTSSVPYRVYNTNENQEPKQFYLRPRAVTLVRLKTSGPSTLKCVVGNILVATGKSLEVELKLK